jgi:hypothetical protein
MLSRTVSVAADLSQLRQRTAGSRFGQCDVGVADHAVGIHIIAKVRHIHWRRDLSFHTRNVGIANDPVCIRVPEQETDRRTEHRGAGRAVARNHVLQRDADVLAVARTLAGEINRVLVCSGAERAAADRSAINARTAHDEQWTGECKNNGVFAVCSAAARFNAGMAVAVIRKMNVEIAGSAVRFARDDIGHLQSRRRCRRGGGIKGDGKDISWIGRIRRVRRMNEVSGNISNSEDLTAIGRDGDSVSAAPRVKRGPLLFAGGSVVTQSDCAGNRRTGNINFGALRIRDYDRAAA